MIRSVLETFPLDFEIPYIRQANQERWILVRYFQHAGDDNVILVGETTAEITVQILNELGEKSGIRNQNGPFAHRDVGMVFCQITDLISSEEHSPHADAATIERMPSLECLWNGNH